MEGYNLGLKFKELHDLKMRVGALPLNPTNKLKYNLTWSTDGLINEYLNKCEAIRDGKQTEILPLEGLENFALEGVDYEAFNTSGGLGTLCDTLDGKVLNLDYKTIRYPNHCNLIQFLVDELKLGTKREILKTILEEALPMTPQDMVLVFTSATGIDYNGCFKQETQVKKIYHKVLWQESWSAIQITTAAALCAVLDLHVGGKLKKQGFVKQEDVSMLDFLGNRYGSFYLNTKTKP
jgi:saccharopine dehydrogenase-like NADP-dependent oxidoreductase